MPVGLFPALGQTSAQLGLQHLTLLVIPVLLDASHALSIIIANLRAWLLQLASVQQVTNVLLAQLCLIHHQGLVLQDIIAPLET
jgi:hypothetical protein